MFKYTYCYSLDSKDIKSVIQSCSQHACSIPFSSNRVINYYPAKTKNFVISMNISHDKMPNNTILICKRNPRIEIIFLFAITVILQIFTINNLRTNWISSKMISAPLIKNLFIPYPTNNLFCITTLIWS